MHLGSGNMKTLIFLLGLFLSTYAFASDYHQRGQAHTVLLTISDSSGDPVSGQTPRVGIKSTNTGLWYDFADGTFKAPNATTTLFQTMTYDNTGGFYYRIVSIDTSTLVSLDAVTVISNDDATYGFIGAESVEWDSMADKIKINR